MDLVHIRLGTIVMPKKVTLKVKFLNIILIKMNVEVYWPVLAEVYALWMCSRYNDSGAHYAAANALTQPPYPIILCVRVEATQDAPG